MFISLPDAVLHAIQLLNDAGFEAYAVGGCVRDALLGKAPEDWDVTTSASPTEMQTVFADYRTIETGLQHGTLTVLIDQTTLEITTYRIDGAYSDGRHPDKVSFTSSLQEDLQRRDFTINAMAYHPDYGVVDLFGGQDDIEQKTIRCVGVPAERFTEDALRILRALRFAAVLGFSIETETSAALQQLSPTLCKVSAERISTEFQKLLCGVYAKRVCEKYSQVLPVFLPEVKACDDYHLLSQVKPSVRSRLAALLYGADVSANEAENALRRLRMDNKTIREVSLILSPITKSTYTEDSYLLRLLNRMGPELTFDYLAVREFDDITEQRVRQLLNDNACYQLSMLAIGGDEVISAGIVPGPIVGEVLHNLLFAVMDGKCENRKADLLEYLMQNEKPVQ